MKTEKQLSEEFDWKNHPKIHRFDHKAMATIYEIAIFHEDKHFAAGAAHEAFKQLDWLEDQLSRYRENSDITRINHLKTNQSVIVGPEAYDCITASQEIYRETGGAFDITVGPLYDIWLDDEKQLRNPSDDEIREARRRTGMKLVEVDRENFRVSVQTDDLTLDLGGVGKGYAVDVMADLLVEWGVDTCFIHGGKSTVKALKTPPGTDGWPITISTPGKESRVIATFYLRNRALSGSGLQKGEHIIDPRTSKPVEGKVAAWTSCENATKSDAYSTAFMIMTPPEIERLTEEKDDLQSLVISKSEGDQLTESNYVYYGDWQTQDLRIELK
ncbi:MAG: hypothetical protein GF372_02940 [Candidatus Marinimicrobia bacterium]|nr:hypothetical protein [Candidatus Neomarinimicrobiota bacterium]